MAAGDFSEVAYTGSVTATEVKGNTSQAKFIPELWSDEVIAQYKQKLTMGNLVKKMSMVGKKGDTIHVPKPYRQDANAKAEATAVTIMATEADEVIIPVDRHFEYSVLIEDITDKQALSSMRRHYTDDAGYALAKQVDNDIFRLGTALDGGAISAVGTPANWVQSGKVLRTIAGAGLEDWAENDTAAADVFSDEAMRGLVQKMDDNDVPMDMRYFVVCPSLKNKLLSTDRYVSTDFVNGKPVVQGYVGNVYGVEIYVSTNVPVIETAAQNGGASVQSRGNFIFHKDAFVFAEQVGVRTQTQYKQEYLADLLTADTIYGTQVYRPEAAFVLATAE
jgi:N4-gp56 family major capsid protein